MRRGRHEAPPGCKMIQPGAITIEQRPLHVLNRLAFGPCPGDLETVKRIGPERWIEQQLNRGAHPQPEELARQLAALETLRMTPVQLFMSYGPPMGQAARDDPAAKQAARRPMRIVVRQAMRARLFRDRRA